MHRRILLLIVAMATLFELHAQGSVRGRVSDTSGETVPGATVTVKDAGSTGPRAVTDLDGNFSIILPQPGRTVLQIVAFSYRAYEMAVEVPIGGVVVMNAELTPEHAELKSVEVVAKARRSGDAYLDRMRSNAPASLDYISRDMMLKTGDTDAAAAVKRVPGVSTVGAFISVRGLSDRYLVTTINGGRIPTLDPFTNNLRLDLFPTGLMDNIIITKASTPDLPGDWAGAYLSMNTSDYPEQLRVNVSTTIGYNPSSMGRPIVLGGTSSTDFMGRDDGMRAIPDGFPGTMEEYPVLQQPNLFQQLSLLGLGSYMSGLGITANTPGFSSSSMNSNSNLVLQHLMLARLGLLAPAQVLDPNAVLNGVNAYNSTYNNGYFSPLVNGELARLNTQWDNARWRLSTRTGGPNVNSSVSIGNRIMLAKKSARPKELGFLVGFRYATETQNDQHSTMLRTIEDQNDPEPGDTYQRKGEQHVSQVSSGWNAMGNLSFKLDPDNSFSLMVMGNVLGQNNGRYLTFLDPGVSGETFVSEEQFWEQRRLWVAQYASKHRLPGLELTITPEVSYSTGTRDILDLRILQYVKPAEGQPITDVDGALRPPGRIFRFLDDRIIDSRIGFERPLGEDRSRVRKVKFGGSYRTHRRTNDQNYFAVQGAPGPEGWQTPGGFAMQPDGSFVSLYVPRGSFKDNDYGQQDVTAGYLMVDYAFTPRLRFAGGVRSERTDQVSDIRRFHDNDISATDPVRGSVGDVLIDGASGSSPRPAVPGVIDNWDLLPSGNLIWKLRDESKPALNLRAGYFRSLSRPSFREFSVVYYYDFLLQAPIYGNPALRMTYVDNWDLRLENFFSTGDNISVSGFYKRFKDHIELLQTVAGGFTWRNADRSRVFGLEIEGRVRPMRQLEWRGNITLMDSRSDLVTEINGQRVEYSTPMFGQSPYIINSTFTYSFDSLRLDISAAYNVQGPRLAVTNAELQPNGIRAFEMPRHLVDITVNKRFGKHWGVMLRARDLLNAPIRRSYKFSSGYALDFDRYTYGTEYLITVSYTIK